LAAILDCSRHHVEKLDWTAPETDSTGAVKKWRRREISA
jgi:hypothetical protein